MRTLNLSDVKIVTRSHFQSGVSWEVLTLDGARVASSSGSSRKLTGAATVESARGAAVRAARRAGFAALPVKGA